ncbi:MAG: pyridoxal phosphate-dependent aminotransferase, partial [Rhodothermales bacterium]|nr:pyridoxal phosphate-dependent aminotransferase [Rhodothermales bacterium]
AKQSVAQAIYCLAGSGDEVIIPSPFWVSYPEMVKLGGATPVIAHTGVKESYKLTPAILEAAITDRSRVLILCSPSNPTGVVYTPRDLEEIAEVLRPHDQITVISDEIYEHIVYDVPFVSFGTLDGMKERTVTVNGFSKGFAMTGWRLGYMAGEKQIIKAASKLQSQLTSAPSSISQRAGVAALEMDMDSIRKMVDEFRRRRDKLVEWAQSDPRISCPVPDGAFYLFPDIGAYLGTTTRGGRPIETSTDLCMYLLEDHNVALVPGDAFGSPTGIRISYAAAYDDIVEASRRISAGLSQLS